MDSSRSVAGGQCYPLLTTSRCSAHSLRFVAQRASPSLVVVAGFSSGADIALELAGQPGRTPVAGLLSLGCNLSIDTCFVTSMVAKFRSGAPEEMLNGLRAVSAGVTDIDAWLTLQAYLVRMVQRFRGQMEPLQRLAGDLVAPFQISGETTFVQRYRAAAVHARTMRYVFDEDPPSPRLVRESVARAA